MKTLYKNIATGSFDGKAGIHDYPWDYTHSPMRPDPYGPDARNLGDYLVLNGDSPLGYHLNLTQIPGTALVMAASPGSIGMLHHSHVHTAVNGVRVDMADSQLDHVNVDNIVKDAFTIGSGGNTFMDVCHVAGADRAFVVNSRIIAHGLFPDNARVGAVFDGISSGSTIEGFPIEGCWELAADLRQSGITIRDISGEVADGKHPGAIGFNLWPGVCHEYIEGWAFVPEDCTLFNVVNGCERSTLRTFGGGWQTEMQNACMVKLRGVIRDTDIDIVGAGDGGVAVDATEAILDESTTIKVRWGGTAKRIVGDTGKANVIVHEVKQ